MESQSNLTPINWLERALFFGTLEMEVAPDIQVTQQDIEDILSIPRIQFISLSPEANIEFHNICKRVLATSKFTNHNREVAITYNINAPKTPEKYKMVLGNKTMAPLGLDNDTATLLDEFEKSASNNNNVVIINIHNHPDTSFFSISDLLFFAEHPSIKIMALINNQAEIGYLYRPQYTTYKCVINNMLAVEPDYYSKYMSKLSQTGNIPSVADIIPQKELRKHIFSTSLQQLKNDGVIIQPFTKQDILIPADIQTSNSIPVQSVLDNFPINLESDITYNYEEGDHDEH